MKREEEETMLEEEKKKYKEDKEKKGTGSSYANSCPITHKYYSSSPPQILGIRKMRISIFLNLSK